MSERMMGGGSLPPEDGDEPSLTLHYTSPDGDQGFPGTLEATITYTLGADNTLRLDYSATADQDTVVNLTNHSYFNLAGGGDILGHMVELPATRFIPVNADLIPTGELQPVAGTPMDFRTPTAVGARIGNDETTRPSTPPSAPTTRAVSMCPKQSTSAPSVAAVIEASTSDDVATRPTSRLSPSPSSSKRRNSASDPASPSIAGSSALTRTAGGVRSASSPTTDASEVKNSGSMVQLHVRATDASGNSIRSSAPTEACCQRGRWST